MRRQARSEDDARALAAAIRASRVLDPLLKRSWLAVLPHLAPTDRARLRAILAEESEAPPAAGS